MLESISELSLKIRYVKPQWVIVASSQAYHKQSILRIAIKRVYDTVINKGYYEQNKIYYGYISVKAIKRVQPLTHPSYTADVEYFKGCGFNIKSALLHFSTYEHNVYSSERISFYVMNTVCCISLRFTSALSKSSESLLENKYLKIFTVATT